eukprot:CAMPEP_0119304592 /NCGR_PEP_ID=MMETSP1333-20130426/5776_1 /TAXON_ID=418940 /ORGANISM="Scyphosphaera apsteinii, Strain RCC1455" /LENGTH=507 /DNA_ID=CAMNT_0007307503 /DNA_START=416 /DNA_END=1939 /DNA_ORIENTATION=+
MVEFHPEVPHLLAEAQSFFAGRGVQLHVVTAAPPGSRTTSRIAVRTGTGAGGRCAVLGLFEEGTHKVLPCEEDSRCHVPHHPAINQAIAAVSSELKAFGALSTYDEARQRGTLRYLQISVERSSCKVQLTLVANLGTVEQDPALPRFVDRLWARYSDASSQALPLQLHSIWVNLNPSATNNIVSYEPGSWILMHAPDTSGMSGNLDEISIGSLVETFRAGASFVLPPFVFRQANLDGFERIVAEVREAIHPAARVVEWYAGVGAFGLSLASQVEWVRCSDINPSHAAFEASRALLPKEVRGRVSYAVGAAAERVEDARGADVALVDPPRKGLDEGLLQALCDTHINSACANLCTLVYVSCGFRALRRDLDALLSAGWRVRGNEATAHCLFWRANHIETVLVLERSQLAQGSRHHKEDYMLQSPLSLQMQVSLQSGMSLSVSDLASQLDRSRATSMKKMKSTKNSRNASQLNDVQHVLQRSRDQEHHVTRRQRRLASKKRNNDHRAGR